jgi:hypothetical protein
MEKSQIRIGAILLIILIVFSVIAFVVPFSNTTVFWVSYVMGVLSLLVLGYTLFSMFGKEKTVQSKFYGFPIARIAWVYCITQLALSLLFMILADKVPTWLPVVIYVILFAAAAIGLIGADAVRDEIVRQDEKLKTDISCMTTLRSIVYPLADQCADPNAKKALQKLAEDFRYSDPVSSEALKPVESELQILVSELQTAVSSRNVTQIMSLCSRISNVLTERNRLCKLNK